MKRTIKIGFAVIFLINVFSFSASAQTKNNKYFIRFTDKAKSPYTVSNPSAYLTPRAIQRRINQHISIKANDIPVNANYIDSVKAKGALILYATKWLNGIVVVINDTSNKTLNKINQLPFVVNTKSVGKRKGFFSEKPNQKSFFTNESHEEVPVKQNNLRTSNNFNYGLGFNQIHMLNGELLHDKGYRGQGVVIAILDAGFYNANTLPAFDSLWINHQILGFKDFVGINDTTFKGFKDSCVFQKDAHGMEVLSTIGGNIPGQLIGTAPKANFWLLRSEQAASEYIIEEINYVRAAEFADSVGVDIIHSSLGYNIFDDLSESHTYKDMNGHTAYCSIGAGIAASKGILVTCSAGNEGASKWHYITAPADGDSVLTVGATNGNGIVTNFSSRGPSADGRVKPCVMAQGAGTAIEYSSGTVGGGNGTSFSGPVMAGMAASLWSSAKNLSNMELYNYIILSSSLYQYPNDSMGYGIPDFTKAYYMITGKQLNSGKAPAEPSVGITIKNKSINEGLSFQIISDTVQKIELDFYTIGGKKVHSVSALMQQGVNELNIADSPEFTKGMYIIQLILPQKEAKYTYKAIKY